MRIEGLEDEESDAIIEEMRAYMVQPPCQYRHKWRKGDVVIWDNRCSYHKAAGDYPPEEDRIHWRVSIKNRKMRRAHGSCALIGIGSGLARERVMPRPGVFGQFVGR